MCKGTKISTEPEGNTATPDIIGLSNLRVLSVSYNQLSGDIPGWVWKLPSLQALDLSNNRFSGRFPATLTHLSFFKLNQTWANSNDQTTLYEELPLMLKNTVRILDYVESERIYLDMSMNNLEGEIPKSFGELIGLRGANLSHNRISGTIPAATFGRLMQLEELDVSYNQLSGGIPQDLTSLDGLSTLNLAHNQLEGPIPTRNHFDTKFTAASFENNQGLYGCPLSSCNNNASRTDVGSTRASRSTGGQTEQPLLIVIWFREFVCPWGVLVGYPAGVALGIFLCRPLSLKLK